MNKWKKALAWLLCAAVCSSCFVTSFATGESLSEISAVSGNTVPQNQPVDTAKLDIKKEDFNDSAYTKEAWETNIINTAGSGDNSNAAVLEEYQVIADPDDAANKVLLPNKSDQGKGPAVMMYKDIYWPYMSLKSVSMKLKLNNMNSGLPAADVFSPIISFYLPKLGDHVEGTQISIQTYTKDGKLYVRCGNNSKYAKRNVNDIVTGQLSAEGWISLTMEYDYTEWAASKIFINYKFTDKNGETAEQKVTYQLTLAEDAGMAGNYPKFGIGSYSNSSGNHKTLFDDIEPVFELAEKDAVPYFYSSHKQLFSLTEWGDESLPLLQAAADDYLALSNTVKAALAESGYIDRLCALVAGSSAAAEYDAFNNKWSALIEKNKVDSSDAEDVQTALAEYGQLSNVGKMLLCKAFTKLQIFSKELIYYRPDNDYSPFDYDFDDELNPFVNVLTEDPYAVNKISTDPFNSDNKVLELCGQNSAFLLKYWPSKGAVKSIKFKVYAPDTNPFTPWRAVISYKDEGNYYAFRNLDVWGHNRLYLENRTDYVGSSSYFDCDLDVTGWITYEVMFTSAAMVVTAKDEKNNMITGSFPFSYGGTFGFTFANTSEAIGRTIYVDDLYVDLQDTEGDFDVDDEPVDIDMYFYGNTFLKPDETLTMQGHQLAKTVDQVFIGCLENNLADIKNDTVMPGVIEQSAYDTDGSTADIRADGVQPVWKNAGAKQMQILQRSSNSINAVIPKELEAGIYAVKLTALQKDKGAQDKVIYVNRPDISFVTGNEGDIVTHGGTFRVIGSNLVPTGNAEDVTVKLIDAKGKIYVLPVTKVEENDAYSLEVAVDETLPYGDYEVYVHNGYGDNTAWSLPSVITVGASPRDAWPKTVFNVKNYGAVGDGMANDTAAIVNALADAEANGGGIVYLPKGVYSVVSTLAIPERVVLKGDNEVESVLRYQAWRWQYGKTPGALLSIIGNTEIKDLAIQGTRVSTVFKCWRSTDARFVHDTAADNIYLTNVNIRFTPRAGYITSGGSGGWATGELTAAELDVVVGQETGSGVKLDFRGGTNNLQFNNMNFDLEITNNMTNPIMRIWGRQVQLKNSSWVGYSLCSSAYGTIIEDCDLKAAGFNPSGNGFYFARNYLHDSWGNNRELFTTDGIAYSPDIPIRFIGDNPELMQKYFGTSALDDTAFMFTQNKYAVPFVENYDLIVKGGQGAGQARIIKEVRNVKVKDANGKEVTVSVFKVDRPFAVNPNRRSRVDVYEPRLDIYSINNHFREGAASGSYGTMINSVWDGNLFERHEGQYFDVHLGSLWYLTLVNQVHREPIYMHGDGIGADGSYANMVNSAGLRSSLRTNTGKYASSVLGFTLRNCKFDGYGYSIGQPAVGEGLSGFVMENCTFENRDTAIYFTSTAIGSMTAILLRDNVFDTNAVFDSRFADSIVCDAKNREGYQRFMVVNSGYDPGKVLLGDVNLDGKLSLKDATLLRFYLLGETSLTEEQLQRADTDLDGKITLKDVSKIRELLLNTPDNPDPPDESTDGPTVSTGSGWIGGDF